MCRGADNSCNTELSGGLGDKCREQLGEPSKRTFLKQQHLGHCSKRLRDKCLGEPSHTTCPTEPQKTNMSVGPKTFIMAEDPEANAVGEKQWKSAYFKQPWWNLVGAICPREPERVRKKFCPETFTMAFQTPKVFLLGKTQQNIWGKELLLS